MLRTAVVADIPAAAQSVLVAFAARDLAGCAEWLTSAGIDNLRVIGPEGGTLRATLLRVPMAQFFGGASVPMLGIAGVTVPPECRGSGSALELMQSSMREARREGWALSGLYASTQPLYRKVGFEAAGHWCETSMRLCDIGVRDRSLEMRPLTDADDGAVRACYTRFARQTAGMLDRGDYIWKRVRQLREKSFMGYAVVVDGAIEGYTYFNQTRDPDSGRFELDLSDLVFTTARAGKRLLGFLSDFQTVGTSVFFRSGPHHPILSLLPTQNYKVERLEYWMTRIVDVKKAIETRGYASGLTTHVDIDIADPTISENAGLWRISVKSGIAKAERVDGNTTSKPLCCDIRGLAAVYSGFLSGHSAMLAGLIAGDDASLDAITSIFAGPTPCMTDMF